MTPLKRNRDSTKSSIRKKTVRPVGTRIAGNSKRSPLDPRGSVAYRQAVIDAATYIKSPERLGKLLEDAAKKTKGTPRNAFEDTWAYLMTMIRLLRAYYRREYRDLPRKSLISVIATVIYFVSPTDFIPDWIPVAGFLDDSFLVAVVLKSVKDDLDLFMQWEAQQS